MKQLLITIAASLALTGCAKNELKLTNKGVKKWQHIEVKSGGHVFEVRELKGGATETSRFKSIAEGGGQVNGKLDGQVIFQKAEFGYFTPNLATRFEISLDDSGTISNIEVP